MTAREVFARLVYEDQAMQDLGFSEDNVFATDSVTNPQNLDTFIVISSELTEKAFGTTGPDTVNYWVHRNRALGSDYSKIDLALLRLRELLTEVMHFAGSDGWVLSAASWVDQSRDLVDEGFNTICKFTTFRAAVRSAVTP